jgi:DNA-binding transcriptional MerR regulator
MPRLTEVERGYLKDWIVDMTAAQSASVRGVKSHTAHVQRSALRRKLEILLPPDKVYTRILRPKPPRCIKTAEVARRCKVSIDTLQWWVKREEKREGGPLLPLPNKVNERYRWTAKVAGVWIEYSRSQAKALSTIEVAEKLGLPVEKLRDIVKRRAELYSARYNEWHTDEVERLRAALAVANPLAQDEAQASGAA